MENTGIDNKVYVLVVNKLTLMDIDKMPNLQNLTHEGSFGLMNVRGLNGYRGGEGFATINASAKAYANNESSQFYNLNQVYKKIYENRAGSLDKEYAIGNIQIGRLYNQNQDNDYTPHIGALGDSIHKGKLKTAVFGNSDTDEENIRTAALIPMDSKGLIDYGDVDNTLTEDMDYPYGIKTDYNKILKDLLDASSKASLIVIDTGDLYRLHTYGGYLSMDMFNKKRDMILEDIDKFIGNLISSIDREKSLLIVLSPNSGEERIDGNRLSPILLWGRDFKKGTVISTTTNRTGIISNLDIAPTIANFLNTPLDNMAGNIIKSVEKDNPIEYINSINKKINTTSMVRSKTLSTYGTISAIVLLLIISLFLLNMRLDNRLGKWIKTILLLLYGMPLVFILISLFFSSNLYRFILGLALFIFIFTLFLNRYQGTKTVFFMTHIYLVIIIADILLDGIITKFSVLSHDPIIGARYYGIGNEMVGVFLAAATLSSGLLYNKFNNRYLSLAILIVSTILVGYPKLGANVGGTIAFMFASLYFILETMNRPLSFKNIALIFIIIGGVIAVLGYIDSQLNPNPTHLGRTLIHIGNNGISIVRNIINRKLLMNVRLVGVSTWTKVLLVNIFAQFAALYFSKNNLKKLYNSNLGKGILSSLLGSIFGFLANDSGLILAAISINLVTLFLLFIIINNEEIYGEQEVN